jgi:hypothetical protein
MVSVLFGRWERGRNLKVLCGFGSKKYSLWQSQDFGPIFGHQNGVLEVGGNLPVSRPGGPAIGGHDDLVGA